MIQRTSHKWAWIAEELEQLQAQHLSRELVPTRLLTDGMLERNGQRMLNLASNDYLGLASEGLASTFDRPLLRSGSGASRLIAGHDPTYVQLESELAAYKETERALIFSSGYMANAGLIPALVGRQDVVFSDRLNHASIVDGIQLSRAKHARYRHRDLDQLEAQLKQAPQSSRKLIVTDTLFSMDGTCAPLQELVVLKQRYGALLMVDEAHSGGVYGTEGQGLVHAMGLAAEVDIQMGTFSKAYGCCGAYVAGDDILIRYLVNRARTFVFNTALPPMVVEAIYTQWQRSVQEGWRRERLQSNARVFRAELEAAGWNTGGSESQIIPIIIGDNACALSFSKALQEAGIAAVAIRPPTVPDGTARIRFTIMATHQMDQLQQAAAAINTIGKQMGMI